MLRLTGKVDVSQRLTDLKAGQKYALYVLSLIHIFSSAY